MAPPSIGVLPKLTPSSALLPHAHSAIAPDGVLLVLRLRGPEEAGGAELRHDGSLAGAPLGVAHSRLCHLCGEGWGGGGEGGSSCAEGKVWFRWGLKACHGHRGWVGLGWACRRRDGRPRLLLFSRVEVDAVPVLRAHVGVHAVEHGGVDGGEEGVAQGAVRGALGVEEELYRLGVSGATRAYLRGGRRGRSSNRGWASGCYCKEDEGLSGNGREWVSGVARRVCGPMAGARAIYRAGGEHIAPWR
eukprot:scaffold1071_cov113-Isochrysis_galbana.AAC.5